MRTTVQLAVFCFLILASGLSVAEAPFDGTWLSTLSCPVKDKMEAFSWQFTGVIQNSHFRGEHGTAGQSGYLVLEGDIAPDGSAKLSAKGLAASRKIPQGERYSYLIDAQFRAAGGSGSQSERFGFMRHTCRFESAKLQPGSQPNEQ